jgi:hypothetical protein
MSYWEIFFYSLLFAGVGSVLVLLIFSAINQSTN